MRKTIRLGLALLTVWTCQAQTLDLVSPNSALKLTFTLKDGAPGYTVSRFGETLIAPSKLGLLLDQNRSLAQGFEITSAQRRLVDETLGPGLG